MNRRSIIRLCVRLFTLALRRSGRSAGSLNSVNRGSSIGGDRPPSTGEIDDHPNSFFEPRRRNRLTFARNKSHIVAIGQDEDSRRFVSVGTSVPFAEARSDDVSLPDIFLLTPHNYGTTSFFSCCLSDGAIAPVSGLSIVLEPFVELGFTTEESSIAIRMFASMKDGLRTEPGPSVL